MLMPYTCLPYSVAALNHEIRVQKTDYGVVIPSTFCQRCSVQTVASFSVFIYLWELCVWFELLHAWNVSCGCKCPKSIFGDMCFAYLQIKYYDGPVSLFWNQLWKVAFKMINFDTLRALSIMCYLLWIYISIYVLRVGILNGVGLNWSIGSRPRLYSRE